MSGSFVQSSPTRSIALSTVLIAALAMMIPTVVSAFWLRSLTSSLVFSLAALGAAFLFGRLQVASLCQVALVAIGGWVGLRLSHATDVPFLVSVVTGGLVTAGFGIAVGFPALRIRGLYFALVTLMVAAGIEKILQATGFPDGGGGVLGVDVVGDRTAMARPSIAVSDAAYFRYCVVLVAVCFFFVALLQAGRVGRMWASIGRGGGLDRSLGINTPVVQTAAFGLAGFLSGIGGVLLAGSVGYLDPATFRAQESIVLFALAVACGTVSPLGPIFAALLYRAIPTLLNSWDVDGDLANVIFGVALLQALIQGGDGLSGQLIALAGWVRRRFTGRRGSEPPAVDESDVGELESPIGDRTPDVAQAPT